MSLDEELISYVQAQINSGKVNITLPMNLVERSSKDSLQTINQLAKLNKVRITIIP